MFVLWLAYVIASLYQNIFSGLNSAVQWLKLRVFWAGKHKIRCNFHGTNLNTVLALRHLTN